MDSLEFTDLDILDVVYKGLFTTIHQSSSDGASGSKLKGKYVPGFKMEVKRILNLDVNVITTIGNPLPFSIYSFVQNCSTAPPMMITLSSGFEKENSSDNECKFLMAHIFHPHNETDHDNVEILCTYPPHAEKDMRSEWDDAQCIRERILLISTMLIILKKMTQLISYV
ncbi:unnamed protein product [Lactuca saligna]|uniref:Uncharacterized protein n=1 Tax=Lactuca saligna TaxID=75948 RepID=A0AA35YJ03_LACSI|nr:unnamed protein product [Lactuca saligna]